MINLINVVVIISDISIFHLKFIKNIDTIKGIIIFKNSMIIENDRTNIGIYQ